MNRLQVLFKKKSFEDLFKELELGGDIDSLLDSISDTEKYSLNLILRRIKLSDNIHDNEAFTKINDGLGVFEEGALRLHLYLTAIELFAKLVKNSKFITFQNWIKAKKQPYKSEKENLTTDRTSDELLIQSYLDSYNDLHGVKTHFYNLIIEGIEEEDQKFLLDNCWVCEKNPLPYLAKLSHINGNEELCKNRATNDAIKAKKSWDIKDNSEKLKLIAKALFLIRNSYTHELIPYTSVQDKTVECMIPGVTCDRGDDIYIWDSNIAISFCSKPSTFYFRNILIMALRKYIKSKTSLTNHST